jgi:hypothetical protein
LSGDGGAAAGEGLIVMPPPNGVEDQSDAEKNRCNALQKLTQVIIHNL